MTATAVNSLHLQEATLSDLPRVREFISTGCNSLGGHQDAIDELIMAAYEAVENIISHGYVDAPGPIVIEISRDASFSVLRIMDWATSFDIDSVPEPDIAAPLSERNPGGLGIHMMRQFTDELSYRTLEKGENELLLKKRCH